MVTNFEQYRKNYLSRWLDDDIVDVTNQLKYFEAMSVNHLNDRLGEPLAEIISLLQRKRFQLIQKKIDLMKYGVEFIDE